LNWQENTEAFSAKEMKNARFGEKNLAKPIKQRIFAS
jgi:hypothetical protein